MIKLPNLDDQHFEEIVNHAIQKIPRIYEGWTDFNIHDPGITLIELFAWLKEMQQYHLDKITSINKRRFLNLLNISPDPAKASGTTVFFEYKGREEVLPLGTRFDIQQVPFELSQSVKLTDISMEKAVVFREGKYHDMTEFIKKHHISFYAFGEIPQTGNSFYLGFNKPFLAEKFNKLYFGLYDPYPVKRNERDERFEFMPRNIKWEYFSEEDEKVSLREMDVLFDKTYALSESGMMGFYLPSPMKKCSLPGVEGEFYWIRGVLTEAGCEESPRIEQIQTNFGFITQKQTLCEDYEFLVKEEEREIFVHTRLALFGKHEVQIRDGKGGWLACMEGTYEKEFENGGLKITLHEPLCRKLVLDNHPNVRVICLEENALPDLEIGGSNGLPMQKFAFHFPGKVLANCFKLQIGQEEEKTIRWYDWHPVQGLEKASALDRSFAMDERSGEILFGNGEKGRIPPSGEENIRLLCLAVTEGAEGNVQKNECRLLERPDLQGLFSIESGEIKGGQDAQTLEMAEMKLLKLLKKPNRAVTARDYEYIAMKTPGIRLAKVKAIPLHDPQTGIQSEEPAQDAVTLVVAPYNHSAKPMPDEKFLGAIRRWVDKHRLINTKLSVVKPVYIEISVYVELMVKGDETQTVQRVDKILKNYLSPLKRMTSFDDKIHAGWEFGKPVRESELISLVSNVEGVILVKRLSIAASGNGWKKMNSGDVFIPPHGLIFSGDHEYHVKEI